MIHTTFAQLREHGACETKYRKLADRLGGITKYGRDTLIPADKAMEVVGWRDTLWGLRAAIEPVNGFTRDLYCDYLESVLALRECAEKLGCVSAYTSLKNPKEFYQPILDGARKMAELGYSSVSRERKWELTKGVAYSSNPVDQMAYEALGPTVFFPLYSHGAYSVVWTGVDATVRNHFRQWQADWLRSKLRAHHIDKNPLGRFQELPNPMTFLKA